MLCPTCKNISLVMSERSGIEIDYCPQCRGVWLDRGELDKIIERSPANAVAPSERNTSPPQNYKHYEHQNAAPGGYYKKKKDNFLSDLFDF